MPRRKPIGWPKYMVARRLAGGAVAYYWTPPTWAKHRRCPLEVQSLGTDYATAKSRCDHMLNPHFDAWRTGNESAPTRALHGSFDWLVSVYKASPRYANRPAATRKSYDSALALVANYSLKDGRRFGDLSLASITPGAADNLFDKLRFGEKGNLRTRTAVLSMVVAKLAWNTARRSYPKEIPADNPFAKMQLEHEPTQTRAPTHDELLRLVAAADTAGEHSLGDAAMIAFYWLQRETDIIGRLGWAQYRPADNPDVVKIWHHKTGELVELPRYDSDEDKTPLWPEIMERLDSRTRRGTLVVTRDMPDRRRKIHLPWKSDYFRHVFAELREAAKIEADVKFMGLRHGGNTEGADAGLTDAQMRALSGHRSPAMTIIYAKQTLEQRRVAARKRLDSRAKKAD